MKIFLTGHGGQLGGEWHRFLDHRNREYRAYGSGELDITDFGKVESVLKDQQPDVLINCAAYTAVDRAEEEREKADLVNNAAVGHLAEICRQKGIKLVHYSTDYVFDGCLEDRNRFPAGYPEDHPANPVNWYGKTKWRGEQAIRESGGDHLIVRTTWLCGRFGNNFVKTMLRMGRQREDLKVIDDQWGSPSFTDDIVGNTAILLRENRSGTYHLTSGGVTTWYEFAGSIFEYSQIDVNMQPVGSDEFSTAAKRPHFSKLSTGKAESVPGVEITDWREGLKTLLKQLLPR